ncbi:hypothetical protein [Andreprevotia lacus]|uniref:hypothetical protein n=1 Tax=Andreprevotia lacus TaxID=1121000 RepID=UPI0009FE0D7D|nr:hypothetical protein [Andreprevotia lacus]
MSQAGLVQDAVTLSGEGDVVQSLLGAPLTCSEQGLPGSLNALLQNNTQSDPLLNTLDASGCDNIAGDLFKTLDSGAATEANLLAAHAGKQTGGEASALQTTVDELPTDGNAAVSSADQLSLLSSGGLNPDWAQALQQNPPLAGWLAERQRHHAAHHRYAGLAHYR